MVWQLQEVEALAAEPSPDPSKVERSALQISQFLSSSPDFLEPLLTSPFGRVYKLFLERCCRENFLDPLHKTAAKNSAASFVREAVMALRDGQRC